MPRRPAADARRYHDLGQEIERLKGLRAEAVKAKRGTVDLDALIRAARNERLLLENINLGKVA